MARVPPPGWMEPAPGQVPPGPADITPQTCLAHKPGAGVTSWREKSHCNLRLCHFSRRENNPASTKLCSKAQSFLQWVPGP